MPIIEQYQLSNGRTPEKLLPNYIACTEEHGSMWFLPRGVRVVPSHRVSRKGKPKELEKQVLLRGWRLLSSVFLHLLLEKVAVCVCPCPAKGGPITTQRKWSKLAPAVLFCGSKRRSE